jgi:hypothetical protein
MPWKGEIGNGVNVNPLIMIEGERELLHMSALLIHPT